MKSPFQQAFAAGGDSSRSIPSAATHQQMLDKVRARARRLDTIGHLGPEAVVAFVDGEMSAKAAHRVRVHVVHCAECRAEVHQQRGASEWVRQCNVDHQVRAPQDLLAKLNGIASACTPGPDAETPTFSPPQDILDKFDTLYRALRRGPRRGEN